MSLKLSPIRFLLILFLMCSCHSLGSEADPVMTTLRTPFSSSLLSHSGFSFAICLNRSTQILLDMQTIMPFPSKTAVRSSKWLTTSRAIRSILVGEPATFSTLDHLLFSFSLPSTSSPSVTSSNSLSIFGLSSGLSSSFASLLS